MAANMNDPFNLNKPTASPSRREWTDDENNILKKYYVLLGSKYCQWYIPHRSIHAIRHQAEKLKLYRDNKESWARMEMDIVLKGIAADKTTSEIREDLADAGYKRSVIAVRDCRLAAIKKYQ